MVESGVTLFFGCFLKYIFLETNINLIFLVFLNDFNILILKTKNYFNIF